MEICGHCHNVLPKTIDRCTVCGTARVDPQATDVRRRDDGDLPSHAPGWAAPSVAEQGLHPDEFVRELFDGLTDPFEQNQFPAVTDHPPAEPPSETSLRPADPPVAPSANTSRAVPNTPPTGALAGYLGSSIERRPLDPEPRLAHPPADPVDPAETIASAQDSDLAPPSDPTIGFENHLSTASKVAPDGVAARTTRLDGTVKLGPTKAHRLITLGIPLAAGLVLVGSVFGSYQVATSDAAAAAEIAEAERDAVNAAAVSQASSTVVTLDLDGCGILDRTTGFLFADQNILVPRSAIETDARPTVVLADGTEQAAVIVGWSITRDVAVVRTEERLSGGLRWGVSGRIAVDDSVSVLAVNGPGVATPVPAVVTNVATLDGANTSFELDVRAAAGSMVLNTDGFVVGVLDSAGVAQVSDELSPAISRIVLADERPASQCPPPPTTLPPAGDDDGDGTDGSQPEGSPADE